jgi:hypothetical protein
MDQGEEGDKKKREEKDFRRRVRSAHDCYLSFICVHISIECQTVIPEVADRHSHGSLKNFRPQKTVETTLLTSSRDSTQGSDSFLESPPGFSHRPP